MDLVTGTKRVIHDPCSEWQIKGCEAMHSAVDLHSPRQSSDYRASGPSDQGLVLKERAPGVTVEQVIAATEAPLVIPSRVPEMPTTTTRDGHQRLAKLFGDFQLGPQENRTDLERKAGECSFEC
jgi:hypothetical protein